LEEQKKETTEESKGFKSIIGLLLTVVVFISLIYLPTAVVKIVDFQKHNSPTEVTTAIGVTETTK